MAVVCVIPELVTLLITGGVVSGAAMTVTLPGLPEVGTGLADGSEAVMPVIPTVMVPGGVPATILSRTIATGPNPIAFWFTPKMMTLTPPATALPEAVLPAAAAADPVAVET
jgi:hypothetical protein